MCRLTSTENRYFLQKTIKEQYASLTDDIERKLAEADRIAAESSVRLSKVDVFEHVRSRINDKQKTL